MPDASLPVVPIDSVVLPPPPGLGQSYNHDLNPSDEVLSSFPTIRDALKDTRLWADFLRYDAKAKQNKTWFHRIGLLTLLLGLAPLLFASFRLSVGELRYAKIGTVGLVADAAGALSVLILASGWLRRLRLRWCQALFCRERLRQWHFQKFMDGQLISLLAGDKASYEIEIKRRWGLLQAELEDGTGYMKAYLASVRGGLLHDHTAYPTTVAHVVQIELLQALWILRFEHQLRYSKKKVGQDGELEEIADWSEWVAKTTLFAAVLVTAASFVCSFAPLVHMNLPLPSALESFTRLLGGIALLLTATSAATRAYRAGYTLPDEVESFEGYADRVREIQAEFLVRPTFAAKMGCLKEIEEEAVDELRRFLKMKTRATFIF